MKNVGTIMRRMSWAALVLAAIAVWPRPVGANSRNLGDELWLISTRRLGEVPCETLASQLPVYRFEDGDWRRHSLDDFAGQHASKSVTVIYVHGNRYTPQDAVERGAQIQQRLRQTGENPPLRFVIWSWPSEKKPGLLNDVRSKAARTDLEGFYLSILLSQFPSDAKIGLVGYSFGTRVISGSLHLLGGGKLAGRALPSEYLRPRLPVRAAMLAPAFHNNWLLPGAVHARALTQVDHLLVFYNSQDPVLKRYRLLSPGTHPQALGFTGLVGLDRLGPLADRVGQRDVANEVGHTHDEAPYLDTSLFPQMRDHLLWRTGTPQNIEKTRNRDERAVSARRHLWGNPAGIGA